MKKFRKFPSIEQFHNVYKFIKGRTSIESMVYASKIKLHGTNAAIGVDIDSQEVWPQKRTQIMTSQNDNFDFALWVEKEENQELFRKLALDYRSNCVSEEVTDCSIIFNGEWVGPGIQKKVALNQLNTRKFVIFSVDIYQGDDLLYSLVRDVDLASMFGDNFDSVAPDVHVLGVYDVYDFRFNDPDKLKEVTEKIEQQVKEIDQMCPWMKEHYGVEGIGEGLVLYPIGVHEESFNEYSRIKATVPHFNFMFKVKGDNHSVNKGSKSIQIAPAQEKAYQELAEKYLTENRFEQILQEGLNNDLSSKNIGTFIKLVALDIQKESTYDFENNEEVNWNTFAKDINRKSVNWFKQKMFECV